MHLADITAIVRRWLWLVIGAAILAGAAGFLFATQQAASYEASTRLLIGPFQSDLNTQRAAGQLTLSYAELIKGQAVVEATVTDLALNTSPNALAGSIRTNANTETRVLTVSLAGGDPATAATILNALVANLIEFAITEETRPEGQITVIDAAHTAAAPVASRAGIVAGGAALGGFLVGSVLALILEYLDNGVRSGRQVSRATGMPLLAAVQPRRRWGGLRSPAPIFDPASEQGFQINLLSAKIEFAAGRESPARAIVLLPVDPNDGSGWLAVNLASAFALRGRQTALVDADPNMEVSAFVNSRRGLAAEVGPGVAAGIRLVRRPPEELGRLSPERARGVLSALLEENDLALVQAAPTQAAPNSIVWANAADAVVLVVRDGDHRPGLTALAETLRVIGAPVVGTIFVSGGRVRVPAARQASEPEKAEGALPPS